MAKRNSTTAPSIPTEGKYIAYDRETRDYVCYLDGQFLGYAPNYSAAETKISECYYEQLSHPIAPAEPPAAAPATIAEALDTDGDMIREVITSVDLGAGLVREATQYTYRERAGAPVEFFGDCESYALTVQAGRIEVEIDDNMDFRRRVHVIFPSGLTDVSNTPAQLLDLAQLLRRDEVFRSLIRWAAEDAAADAAEKAGKRVAA